MCSVRYRALENGNFELGSRLLATLRQKWMDSADAQLRAARHFESAAQILIRNAVLTAKEFVQVSLDRSAKPPSDWVVVEAAARLDLSGGCCSSATKVVDDH